MMRKINLFFKRVIDLLVSSSLLILLLPFFLIVSILLFYKQGFPILFKQRRIGKGNKEFAMYKFRTMTNTKDANGNLLTDRERLTVTGKFLRKTSLDELPGLFNVLIGDMSLIGPRPLLIKYLPYYSAREVKRHDMRPGISGLAQVSGRNHLSWGERLETDVQYVENFSLFLDIKIIWKTIIQVIGQKDVLEVSSDIMPDFDDYRKQQNENREA
jgi:undecaprenyl phosphate N,N'-diacetylbacillosamine 1-phosphate transferase